ncbi:MAG: molybdopterin biosynthesis protein, partial [Anaerolineaceae bacterium]|nr:molybdopterin biosynthesis protein [Anaerolineaceae bacterium]
GDLLVHGIAIRPGHPVILGMIKRSEGSCSPGSKVPIIGVPGYPVSTALTGELFVQTLISRWLGRKLEEPAELSAKLTRKVTSPPGDDDYLRVVVGKVDGQMRAAPISRGAGVISSLVQADGIMVIPRKVQGLEAGADVRVRLYRSKSELEGTIFVIGSHDMTLDLVAQYLSQKDRRLVSANVGSLGGLVSIGRGEAHLAGTHLLDPETGEYNISYIRKYLPETVVKLVTWTGREQGLIVQKGNPCNILTFQDLIRPDISYVNRQRGAGTRVLFDFHLDRMGISRQDIQGYKMEEYTHLSVAAAIASGRAKCGLGIAAAARALDLDFIPLFIERFDLVIPCKYLEDDLLDPLFDLMQNDKFRNAVADLPGYDVSKMGEVILDCT